MRIPEYVVSGDVDTHHKHITTDHQEYSARGHVYHHQIAFKKMTSCKLLELSTTSLVRYIFAFSVDWTLNENWFATVAFYSFGAQ